MVIRVRSVDTPADLAGPGYSARTGPSSDHPDDRPSLAHFEVVVIGAGMGGITAAHKLQRAGITDFVILERADEAGGTWRDNHYPGLAVDLPSPWYQLQFAPTRHWSRFFSPGSEVQNHLLCAIDELGLRRHLHLGCNVQRQRWDSDARTWSLLLEDGRTVRARFVISAVGGYVNAKTSTTLPGLDDFKGTVLRPNAWDDSYDTAGKTVAIVGTGSSGAQITGALSGNVSSLTVFQRTPSWMLPKPDFRIPRWLAAFLRAPGVGRCLNSLGGAMMDATLLVPLFHVLARCPDTLVNAALSAVDAVCRLLYRGLLRFQVDDPQVRRALLPRYGIFGKRPVFTNTYLTSFNHPATQLVTVPIERVTESGIWTADGAHYPTDLIVMATGYEMWTDPETYQRDTLMGIGGFDLADRYHREGLRAYSGTAHPELPNRWELVGPAGFQGSAWPHYVDLTAGHAVRLIQQARTRGAEVVRVGTTAFNRWNDLVDRRSRVLHLYYGSRRTRGVNTYYVNSHGQILYFRPQTLSETKRFLGKRSATDYVFE